MRLEDAWLYMTVNPASIAGGDLSRLCREAIGGGVDIVELQCAGVDAGTAREWTGLVAAACREEDALFVTDDARGPDIGADGLLIREGGMPVGQARAVAGPGRMVGSRAATVDDARLAQEVGADYIRFELAADGFGAVGRLREHITIPVFLGCLAAADAARPFTLRGPVRLCVDGAALALGDAREAAAGFSRLLGREI